MDKQKFFKDLIGFIGNVHASSHGMVKEGKPDSVTPLQHSILNYLFFVEKVTASQIADCLSISLPNTSRELKKLFQKELLEKEVCVTDRRKFSLRLSKKVYKRQDLSFTKIEHGFWEQMGDLSIEEMKEMQLAMKVLSNKIFPYGQ